LSDIGEDASMTRRCAAPARTGEPCRARPLHEGKFCFLHDPARAGQAAEARKLGGHRRRREGTLSAELELGEIDSLDGQWRLLEIIVADALSLDNGVARQRVLIATITMAVKLREASEVVARIEALEAAQRGRRRDRVKR
jgi:hypothetical protein